MNEHEVLALYTAVLLPNLRSSESFAYPVAKLTIIPPA